MVKIYRMRGEKGSFKPYCLEFLDMKNKISEKGLYEVKLTAMRIPRKDQEQWMGRHSSKSHPMQHCGEKLTSSTVGQELRVGKGEQTIPKLKRSSVRNPSGLLFC